MSLLSALQSYH